MTADTITAERISAILAEVHIAARSLESLNWEVAIGLKTPEEAAAIVNDMMTNLNAATR